MNAPANIEAPAASMAADGVVRSDAKASNSALNRKLYKARVPIYPREAEGFYRSVKTWNSVSSLFRPHRQALRTPAASGVHEQNQLIHPKSSIAEIGADISSRKRSVFRACR